MGLYARWFKFQGKRCMLQHRIHLKINHCWIFNRSFFCKVESSCQRFQVPQNTIKASVDIIHFLTMVEFWVTTPTKKGAWCIASRHKPAYLDKQPEERWYYKCQAQWTGSHLNLKRASPQPGRPQPLQKLRDKSSLGRLYSSDTRRWTLNTFLWDWKKKSTTKPFQLEHA